MFLCLTFFSFSNFWNTNIYSILLIIKRYEIVVFQYLKLSNDISLKLSTFSGIIKIYYFRKEIIFDFVNINKFIYGIVCGVVSTYFSLLRNFSIC